MFFIFLPGVCVGMLIGYFIGYIEHHSIIYLPSATSPATPPVPLTMGTDVALAPAPLPPGDDAETGERVRARRTPPLRTHELPAIIMTTATGERFHLVGKCGVPRVGTNKCFTPCSTCFYVPPDR